MSVMPSRGHDKETTVTMKNKLKLENQCNCFDICPLVLCFGELLAMVCPVLLSLKTYQTDTRCPKTI